MAGGNYNLFVTINETSFSGSTPDLEINGVTITNNGANVVNLVKGGVGLLTLNASNTYTGSTVINAGTLQLNNGGNPGTLGGGGPVIVNSGGTLLVNATDALGFNTNTATNSITVNEGGTFSVTAGNRVSMDRTVNVIGGTWTSAAGNGDGNGTYTLRNANGAIYNFTSAADGTPSTFSAVNAGVSNTAIFNVTPKAAAQWI